MTVRTAHAPGRRPLLRSGALLGTVVGAALAVVVLPAAPAAAHTELLRSTPGAGATVDAALDEVSLSFSGAVRDGLAQVVVTGPGGATAGRGAALVSGSDVAQPLTAPLVPGGWTVAYRVVAADGHPLTGTVALTVAAAPAPAPAPAPASAAPAAPPPAPVVPPAADVPAAPASRGSGDSPSAAAAGDLETVSLGGPGGLVLGGLALAAGAGLLLRRRASRAEQDRPAA